MNKRTSKREKAQEGRELENRCWEYLRPILEELHRKVDRRLVKTLLDLVFVILIHRNRNSGLLLSELGDHLLGGARGPAGVKRLASLIHSVKWKSGLIVDYLWKRADEKVKELRERHEVVYAIWDESVLEKSESLQAEGLCAVRSTKAARLKRIKPGYFNPPSGRPIFVPGFNWLQLLVTGLQGAPVLAHLGWWTTRGEKASPKGWKKAKSCEKWQDDGVGRLSTSGIAALLAVRGQLWHWISVCVLSYAGIRDITWWDPMDKSRKAGRFPGADVPGIIAWYGMHADAANEKQVSWRSRFVYQRMTVHSFWLSLVQAMDANPGTFSRPSLCTLPNKLGRLSLLMPDAGKLRCRSVSPNPKWPLNPPDCASGSHV